VKEVLVIPVRNSTMKFVGYSLLFAVFVFSSCVTLKNRNQEENVKIDEKKQIEYTFYFIEGNKLKTLGYFNDAIASFNKCIQLKPNAAVPHYEIANIHIFKNQFEEALHHAKSASQLDPDNEWFTLLFANLLIQGKQYKEAVQLLESKNLEGNTGYERDMLLAMLYSLNQRKQKKAIDLYIEIEEKYGFSEELAFEKHAILKMTGQIDEAVNEIRKLTLLDPNNPRYYGLYAEALINAERFEEAENIYKRLFELDPGNGLAHISYGEYLLNQGKKELALNEFMAGFRADNLEAGKKMNMVLKLETTYQNLLNRQELIKLIQAMNQVHPGNLKGHAYMADFYISKQDFEKARDELLKALENEKTMSDLWEQVSWLDLQIKDYSSLYNHSKTAIEFFPSYAKFYLLHGIACERIKKFDEGIEMLNAGIDYVIDNKNLKAEFYAQMAEIYNRKEDHESSDRFFEKSIELNPDNEAVLNNYSYYLSIRGDNLQRALELMRQVIVNEPNQSTYLDTYAWILFKLGRYEDALVEIEKAIKRGGEESAVILEHYGDILYATGRKQKAILQWERANELNPSQNLEDKITDAKEND
jgi:tetratricopeptide (TPR) repeat protein